MLGDFSEADCTPSWYGFCAEDVDGEAIISLCVFCADVSRDEDDPSFRAFRERVGIKELCSVKPFSESRLTNAAGFTPAAIAAFAAAAEIADWCAAP